MLRGLLNISVTALLLSFGISLSAQELNCTVTINSGQIEGTNKSVFETLKQSITEYMNSNK